LREKKKLKSLVLLMSVILAAAACVLQSVSSSGDKQHLQDLRSFWWTVF